MTLTARTRSSAAMVKVMIARGLSRPVGVMPDDADPATVRRVLTSAGDTVIECTSRAARLRGHPAWLVSCVYSSNGVANRTVQEVATYAGADLTISKTVHGNRATRRDGQRLDAEWQTVLASIAADR